MKKLLYFLLIISGNCYSQEYYDFEMYQINFEDTTQIGRINIDTLSNPENIWQIGTPSKDNFSEAYSLPNAIITDTANNYPANDTSSFTIIHRASLALTGQEDAVLSGYYKVDSDSLMDYGKIELSPDNGKTWIDMLLDSSEWLFEWNTEKPVLTGSSDWTYFWVQFGNSDHIFNRGDTIQFRFSFISDEIQNNRNGLMFDDLSLIDYFEGIYSNSYVEFSSTAFPNPAKKCLVIKYDNLKPTELEIIDETGRLILRDLFFDGGKIQIDVSSYASGFYFYRLIDPESSRASHGRFIVN